jgi:LacI family transcriptional regulator, repressor for deo operon, udp, cdd, tsx, nupC, and nupG
MSDPTSAADRVTIADVAKLAGVATSTVSRALSRPGRVSESMRQKIVSVANEMGYYPNPQARSLKSGRTQNIALLIPDITNPFFFGLFRATQAQARARGYLQFVVNTEESAGVEAAYLAELGKSVDGVVLAASRLSDEELTAAARTMPIVTINRDIPDVPSVIIDTPAAMVQALDHLVSLGHSSIAYLSGPESSWSSRKRWRALQQAARTRKVRLHDLGPFAPTVQAGAAAADSAIATDITACICFNDLLAIGALQRFAERGVRVPQDVSVIGCDDIFGADFCNPPLTTFAAPIEQAGRLATDMLMSVIQDRWGGRLAGGVEGRRHERLSTYLTIRDSTGPAPTTARRGGVA